MCRRDRCILRDAVGIVLQKNVLFSGTVRENLLWGNQQADDETIWKACRAAPVSYTHLNFIDDNTVRVNIKRLRQKLNDEKQEYIVTIFGMGYTFGE